MRHSAAGFSPCAATSTMAHEWRWVPTSVPELACACSRRVCRPTSSSSCWDLTDFRLRLRICFISAPGPVPRLSGWVTSWAIWASTRPSMRSGSSPGTAASWPPCWGMPPTRRTLWPRSSPWHPPPTLPGSGSAATRWLHRVAAKRPEASTWQGTLVSDLASGNGAPGDLLRSDPDQHVAIARRPRHHTRVGKQTVGFLWLVDRFGTPAGHHAPPTMVALIDFVDLEDDLRRAAQVRQHTVRRRAEHDAAVVVHVGDREDLRPFWALPGDSAHALGGEQLRAAGWGDRTETLRCFVVVVAAGHVHDHPVLSL